MLALSFLLLIGVALIGDGPGNAYPERLHLFCDGFLRARRNAQLKNPSAPDNSGEASASAMASSRAPFRKIQTLQLFIENSNQSPYNFHIEPRNLPRRDSPALTGKNYVPRCFQNVCPRYNSLSRALRWLTIAVAVYAILGFLIAPWIVKWQLAKALTRQLSSQRNDRKTFDQPLCAFRPGEGLPHEGAIRQRAGGPFRRAIPYLSSSSIFRLARCWIRIRLERPARCLMAPS